jgi:hypothetical protein
MSLLIEGDEETTVSDDAITTDDSSTANSPDAPTPPPTPRMTSPQETDLFSPGDNVRRNQESELHADTKAKILDFLKGSSGANTTIGDLGENAAVEWLKDHFSTSQSYNTNEMSNNFPFADNVVLVSALNGAYKSMLRDFRAWKSEVQQEIDRTIATVEAQAEASDDPEIQSAAEEGIQALEAAAPANVSESKKKKLSTVLFEASGGVHVSGITLETRQEVLFGTIKWFKTKSEARGIYKNPNAWVWISTKASGAASITGNTISNASPFNSPIHNAGSDGLVILEIINLIRAKGWEWIEGELQADELPDKAVLWNECMTALNYFSDQQPDKIDTRVFDKQKLPIKWSQGSAAINELYLEFKRNYADKWIALDNRIFYTSETLPNGKKVNTDVYKSGDVSAQSESVLGKAIETLRARQNSDPKLKRILLNLKDSQGVPIPPVTIPEPTSVGNKLKWAGLTYETVHQIVKVYDFNVDAKEWLSQNYPTWNGPKGSVSSTVSNLSNPDIIKREISKILAVQKLKHTPKPWDPTIEADDQGRPIPPVKDAQAVKNPNRPVSHINLGGIGLIINFGTSEDDIKGVKWNFGWSSFKEGDLVSSLKEEINSWTRFEAFINAGSGSYKVLKQLEYSLEQLGIASQLNDIIARRKLGRRVGKSIGRYSPSRVSLMSKLGDIDTSSGEDVAEFDDLNYLLDNRNDKKLREFIRQAILAHQNGEDLKRIWNEPAFPKSNSKRERDAMRRTWRQGQTGNKSWRD